MVLLTCRFQKIIEKCGFKKKCSSSKAKTPKKRNSDECHKCDSPNYFIKNCTMWEIKWKENNHDKVKDQIEGPCS